jgi:lysylphosphatidylglycerol synthetase-like protein (DUF2156 family)
MLRNAAESTTELDRRLAAARNWGTFTQAYSAATQDGLDHFWHEEGFLAFETKWRVACVLGDPVVPPEKLEPLLRAFLKSHRRACFWQVSRPTAIVLQKLGFWINEMGVDTRIELAGYSFSGAQKERIRRAGNWLSKHNFAVREGVFSSECAEARGLYHVDQAEIERLSNVWKSTRTVKRDVRFFNRPAIFEDEPDVRKFFLYAPDQKCVAFAFFDPLYRAGQVIGYSPSVKRREPGAPLRAEEGIMKHAIEQFQRERRERVMLGLSPMTSIEDREFKSNPLLHMSWRRALNAWWLNRYFYNLAGHADFKRRFGGVEEKTYFASDVLWNDLRIIGSLRLAGIF